MTGFPIALHTEVILGLRVRDRNLFNPVGCSGFDKQLTLTRVLKTQEQERGFVNSVADTEQAVVAEDAGFVGGTQGRGDVVAFLGR